MSKLTAPLAEWVAFAQGCLQGQTDEEMMKILRTNAEELYSLRD